MNWKVILVYQPCRFGSFISRWSLLPAWWVEAMTNPGWWLWRPKTKDSDRKLQVWMRSSTYSRFSRILLLLSNLHQIHTMAIHRSPHQIHIMRRLLLQQPIMPQPLPLMLNQDHRITLLVSLASFVHFSSFEKKMYSDHTDPPLVFSTNFPRRPCPHGCRYRSYSKSNFTIPLCVLLCVFASTKTRTFLKRFPLNLCCFVFLCYAERSHSWSHRWYVYYDYILSDMVSVYLDTHLDFGLLPTSIMIPFPLPCLVITGAIVSSSICYWSSQSIPVACFG